MFASRSIPPTRFCARKAVAAAMGEDYQKMMKGAGDVFSSIEYNLYAVNPRMSYVSKETEDADPAFWRP